MMVMIMLSKMELHLQPLSNVIQIQLLMIQLRIPVLANLATNPLQ